MIDIYTVGGQGKPRLGLRGWQSVDINDVVCSQEITARFRTAHGSVGGVTAYRHRTVKVGASRINACL